MNELLMAGDRYFIKDQKASYFLTLTVVDWVDIFTRQDYRDVIVNSLNYCVEEKGLVLNSWVVMSNHIHLVGRVEGDLGMSGFLRDFKKFTSKKIISLIKEIPESRRKWLLNKFEFEAKRTGRAKYFKVWKDSNHAIDLTNNEIDVYNKIDYIHMNPVVNRLVDNPEEYLYSSAKDYENKKGLVKVEVI
ncbi:MAG: transposase [Bacteroidota bacterium]